MLSGAWRQLRQRSLSAIQQVLLRVAPPLISRALVAVLRAAAGSLSTEQQAALQSVFARSMEQYIEGHVDVALFVRGVAAVLVDEAEVDDFVHGVLATLSQDSPRTQQQQPANFTDSRSASDDEAEAEVRSRLVERFGCERRCTEKIPRAVAKAVCSRLEAEAGELRCPISYEDLLQIPERKLVQGVSAVAELQSVADKDCETVQVFLFKAQALEQWFSTGGEMNPLTRSRVHVGSQVFPLS